MQLAWETSPLAMRIQHRAEIGPASLLIWEWLDEGISAFVVWPGGFREPIHRSADGKWLTVDAAKHGLVEHLRGTCQLIARDLHLCNQRDSL